jgi:hypothetical protein
MQKNTFMFQDSSFALPNQQNVWASKKIRRGLHNATNAFFENILLQQLTNNEDKPFLEALKLQFF